ncbi:uncharacterized protein LOC106180672 [Lingula anatina]|uniref:Uncharacterized protein LOC106180672 n=1 Tax=Lingula anatina TaxID=7574 RepID=A0A1S3KC17_LINAN|nr:uncharacterized protein LOC106180672 [Lingula anatina]XP_013420175.1 uncharacterized protein LOC106180672 [Lingula anatina]|eukprot:XP_013420174.1 uncharacterized protein LOC106180672 [Lingula anatina]
MFWRLGRRCRLLWSIVIVTVILTGLWFMILSSAGGGSGKITVAVVEEHHEVLRYWYEAVNKGLLAEQGNVLIHVDGHSDNAPPELIEDFPFFHRPRNSKELAAMLQRNDAFILGAISTGLFSSWVWIWPSWDKNNEQEHPNSTLGYEVSETDVGWFWLKSATTRELEKKFCMCEVENGQRYCMYADYDHFESSRQKQETTRDAKSQSDDIFIPIPASHCQIKNSVTFYQVRDDVAVRMMKDGSLVKPGSRLVLDIDEDYYGCESGAEVLLNSGIKWDLVQRIDDLVSEMICPLSVYHEQEADGLLTQLIDIVVEQCNRATSNTGNSCGDTVPQIVDGVVPKLMKIVQNEPYTKEPISEMFCSEQFKHNGIKYTAKKLVKHLAKLTAAQLQTLRSVGFCLITSPNSIIFDQGGNILKICHGANTPFDSVVSFHTPNLPEIDERTRQLREILHQDTYGAPKIVTVCRSMRDGYTPKKYWKRIEKDVLNVVLTSQTTSFEVVYDENLLGGRSGWPYGRKH